MRVIVGLGNPGKRYTATRHNAGFAVLDELAKECFVRFKRSLINSAYIAKINKEGQQVLLIKPATFMNNSGVCVKKVIKRYGVKIDDVLVVYDDADLKLGAIRFRMKGSSAGHKGMSSVMEYLGTDLIQRIRIGIGRPENSNLSDYVLSGFAGSEKEIFRTAVEKASRCCWDWIDKEANFVMQECN